MKVGISTANFFARRQTEQALQYLIDNNIDRAEVFLESSSEYSLKYAKELKRITKNKINLTSVHAMSSQFEPQLFSIAKRQKKDAQDVFERVLKSANYLAIKKYVFHGAMLLKGALKNNQIQRFAKIIDELAEIAKQYDIKLCFENVSWCIFNNPEYAHRLLEYSKSDNLFFTMDIKQARRSGFDYRDYIKAMGERLMHIHISDYYMGKDAEIRHCLAGKGEFDFYELYESMKKHKNAGDIDVIVESYSDSYDKEIEVIEAYRYIKNIFEG